MSNVLDKSFIHRSYPKLAYGSIYKIVKVNHESEQNGRDFVLIQFN